MDVLTPSTSGGGDFVNLFERARRALTSRLQLEPVIADALALPGSANQAGMRPSDPGAELAQDALETSPARLIAELAVDERTRRLVVRWQRWRQSSEGLSRPGNDRIPRRL